MDTQAESSKFFYDVFLSFSGKDTRQNFIGHLYDRLHRDGFNTFKDDKKLRVGDEISPALEEAIENSSISIVVLSTTYASSRWCLDELVKVLECRKRLKQRVMPIFYDVLPTEVRKQTGEFGKEFDKLKERFGDQMMEKWEAALNEVANLSGSELRVLTNGDEAEFVGKIIQDVRKEVNHIPLHVASYPVGIDSRAKDIELLLQKGSEDKVRMVGIYGLGGIGKTTLAKDIYNRLSRDGYFDGCCFLPDVRSEEEKNGLAKVQEQLLNMLFKTEEFKVHSVDEGMCLIKRKLERKKILIVLDDVDKKKQLESLTKEKGWFGSGSIVVITTRDERLVRGFGANERYEAKLLNENESQQLFYLHAFDGLSAPEEYVELAHDIIKYSGGLPLALVTLGSYLRWASIEEWKTEFKKLKAIPHDDIHNILKISFDGLPHDHTKPVFLDIACFFVPNYHEDAVVKILNSCGFYSESAISTLIQRHLLQRDGQGQLVMHDLVRDMGREIVRSESQYPGERSRLFIREEVEDVLQGHSGSRNVEVLMLYQLGEIGVDFSTEVFEPMKKLRVLMIDGLYISGDFGLFPKAIKWLSWKGCVLKYIPPNFPAANLVVLDMSLSSMEQFGLNLQDCPRLKELNLFGCTNLRETPNFNGATSLETLNLELCYKLTEIDQSICQLKNLTSLCATETDFPQFPEFVEKLQNLRILQVGRIIYSESTEGSVIKSLSTSLSCLSIKNYGLPEAAFRVDIGSLSSLTSLDLSGNNFHRLPFDFSKLELLKELNLNDCENLHTLPSLANLENLEILGLMNCKKLVLVDITGLDNLLYLTKIDMHDCNSLQNPFNEDFFRAHALSIKHPDVFLQINAPYNEIPDWCSNKAAAPFISLTMPRVYNKFLGMVLWFVGISRIENSDSKLFVDVSSRGVFTSKTFCINIPRIQDDKEQSCVHYISCINEPFARHMMKGGEEILVYEEYSARAQVKKIGIHLLYLDEHAGIVTSLPQDNIHNCNSLQNLFNEDFFRAYAVSSFPSIKHPDRFLGIEVPCNEIPDWCSNKAAGQYISLTMPRVSNEYKFLGMVLWVIGIYLTDSIVVDVMSGAACMSSKTFPGIFSLNEEQTIVYYISSLNNPFAGYTMKGGEEIFVHQKNLFGRTDQSLFDRTDIVEKIGIHVLYSDKHGNVTSLPQLRGSSIL